jgi:hypothetical protein
VSDLETVVVVLTVPEARWALNGVRDLIARHAHIKKPIPDELHAVHKQLASSAHGTKTCAQQEESAPSAAEELIDTTEAAAILHCSDSWVRRPHVRKELGGRKVAGRYVFPRQIVVQYAARKAGQQK